MKKTSIKKSNCQLIVFSKPLELIVKNQANFDEIDMHFFWQQHQLQQPLIPIKQLRLIPMLQVPAQENRGG